MTEIKVQPKVQKSTEMRLYDNERLIAKGATHTIWGRMIMAKALKEIRDDKLYLVEEDTWIKYLKLRGMAKSTANNWIRTYEKFGDALAKRKGGELQMNVSTRLYNATRFVKDSNGSAEKWLESACTDGDEQFADNVREATGKTATDTCNHEETKYLKVCVTCNKCIEVVENETAT